MLLFQKPKEYNVKVEGMKCQNCAKGVKNALLALKEVKKAEVDLENKNVQVFAKTKNEEEFFKCAKEAIENLGFEVLEIK